MTTQLIIGIAGGSGSGKTTFASELMARLDQNIATLICHDAYYRPLTHLSHEERAATNFDHPSAIETPLLVQHLSELRKGNEVEIPEYDFARHDRRSISRVALPKPVILVEGIMILAESELRALMDIRVFVDAPEEVRLQRRTERDIRERGRTHKCVHQQWVNTVKPMHDQYVESSKQHAHVVVPHLQPNPVSMEILLSHIQRVVQA